MMKIAMLIYSLLPFATIKTTHSSYRLISDSLLVIAFAPPIPSVRSTMQRAANFAIPGRKQSAMLSTKGENIKNNTPLILSILSRMTYYVYSMIDPRTNRFYYRCLPEEGVRIHGHCPIRDLGSAWDTTTLLNFWRKQQSGMTLLDYGPQWDDIDEQLSKAVNTTIGTYMNEEQIIHFKASHDYQHCAAISSSFLGEACNIAHSAFTLLASTGALRLSLLSPNKDRVIMNGLVNGILSMEQNKSGAFAIQFGGSDIYRGIEFYPGEALLSLLDILQYSAEEQAKLGDSNTILLEHTANEITAAATRSFIFYSNYYHDGNVDEHYTSFFGNWQVQCFRKLHEILHQKEQAMNSKRNLGYEPTKTVNTVTSHDVAEYIFELCDSIINSRSWHQLMKGQWRSLATVEIACGLEALADGSLVALQLSSADPSSRKVTPYEPFIDRAVEYIRNVQDQVDLHDSVGSGGLGHSILVKEQRLDVTGHAVNALVKIVDLKQQLT